MDLRQFSEHGMQNIISIGIFHLYFFVGTILVGATENKTTLDQVEYCAEIAIYSADLYSNHLE